MAKKKYNTTHQHEPLPIPREWAGDAERFALRTEEALDDLYRIINRMKLSDLAGDLKLADNDGNTTVSISQGGDITAKSLSAEMITVNGDNLLSVIQKAVGGKVIVSEEQPDAHGVVWIKPIAGSGESGEEMEEAVFSARGADEYTRTGNTAAFAYMLSDKTGSISKDECKYHASVRVCNTKGKRKLQSIFMDLTSWYGGGPSIVQIVSITGLNMLVNPGDYITIDNEDYGISQDYPNVTSDDYLIMSVLLVFSDDGSATSTDTATVRAYTTTYDQRAVKTCEVYYLS